MDLWVIFFILFFLVILFFFSWCSWSFGFMRDCRSSSIFNNSSADCAELTWRCSCCPSRTSPRRLIFAYTSLFRIAFVLSFLKKGSSLSVYYRLLKKSDLISSYLLKRGLNVPQCLSWPLFAPFFPRLPWWCRLITHVLHVSLFFFASFWFQLGWPDIPCKPFLISWYGSSLPIMAIFFEPTFPSVYRGDAEW